MLNRGIGCDIVNQKEIFYQDKENCKVPFSHVMEPLPDPSLSVIDEIYGAADTLSILNAKKHDRILLSLSIIGTLITLSFLLYDAMDFFGLILACAVMILFLFLINHFANKFDCHKKYLEYRVLAESLRVQFFLSMASINLQVSDIMPWFIKKGIPWIEEVLLSLPQVQIAEKMPIVDCWIIDQKEYHKGALSRAEAKKHRDEIITKLAIVITVVTYVIAVFFEIFVYGNIYVDSNEFMIRSILKIFLGTMSAFTLFTGSYYGKLSLSNRIDDHKRMISLYEQAESDISQQGETDELLLFLAREFLIENSTWYAYQSKNKPDIVI